MNDRIKRFNKLENIKNKEVESLEIALKNQRKILDELKQHLVQLEQDMNDAVTEFATISDNGLHSIEDLWEARMQVESIEGEIAQTSMELRKCEIAVENITEELLNRYKEAKIMERAANRLYEKENSEKLAKEQSAIDDISLSHMGRNGVS
ncbi:flagellar export protein FliJ [Acetomicrobium hydrogeniformans]|jgi:flagellar export protein FliJ|uniref:Flagellar FliJ protein n=1 Tax=Acetomicrobium hydrogeniformans ATCC BAA-1850 TaxID=592015 RepID=A0A0T5XB61_9BACT|nr:flagellar FliJ family protein [Acetomicrobium hydrogeniformans]KRT35607.1 putative flagellar export protein FliJ [Acetomicrobium hydrogeniformans ATCC BAA-1850]